MAGTLIPYKLRTAEKQSGHPHSTGYMDVK